MSEWSEFSVGQVAAPDANSTATGPFGSSIGSRFFRSSGVPVIRGSNLSSDSSIRLIDENLVFLDYSKAREFERSIVREGDLIFTSWGTIDQVGLIDRSVAYDEYVISNKQMKVTPNRDMVSSEFLYYLFSTPEMQREIVGGAIGSSIPGFNLTRLRAMRILLPDLEEQERIAGTLADSDHLIASLARLIDKKRAIKQGMMQELLTGRVRLPGFDEPWKDATAIAELCSLHSGVWGAAVRSGVTPNLARVITAGDIDQLGRLTGYTERFLTNAQMTKAKCQTDDVVITASGNGLGKTYHVMDPANYVASNFLRILRPRRGITGAYLALCLRSRQGHDLLVSHTATSAYPNLLRSFFTEHWLTLPSIAEQQRISEWIGDAEAEIRAIERRLEETRAIKQGMMQELLTGRTRLQVEGVVE